MKKVVSIISDIVYYIAITVVVPFLAVFYFSAGLWRAFKEFADMVGKMYNKEDV